MLLSVNISNLLLWGGVLVALYVAWHFWKRHQEKAQQGRAEQINVVELLHEAMDARATFNVRFEVDSMRDRYLRGPCVAVGEDSILIDANLTYGVPGWAGQQVQIYFSTNSNSGSSFYEFTTTISRTVPYLGNVGIELFLPDKIITNQRRSFVRFSPPNRFVGSIHIWNGRLLTQLDGLQPSQISPPLLSGDALSIDNISAGGLRLLFPTGQFDAMPVSAEQSLLLNLTLRNAEGAETLNLWFVTSVVQEIRENERSLLSLKFIRWAPEGEKDVPLSWFPLGREGGVPPVAAWVMRRQLEVECRTGNA